MGTISRSPWGLISFMALSSSASADQLRVGVAVEQTSGTYGGRNTITQFYVPLSATYSAGHFGAGLTVPYLRVTTPAGSSFAGESGRYAIVDEGLGDILLSLGYFDLMPREPLIADVSFKVKFGTADPNVLLGTGEDDYTIQVNLARPYRRVIPFGSVGHRVTGDPGDTRLRDVWFGQFGLDYNFGNGKVAGISYYQRESTYIGAAGPQEASISASTGFDGSWRVGAYVIKGFTNASPDWGFGLTLSSIRSPLHQHDRSNRD